MRSRLRGALPLLFDDEDDFAGVVLGVEVVVAAAVSEAEGLEELDFLDFFFFSWKKGGCQHGVRNRAKGSKKKEQRGLTSCQPQTGLKLSKKPTSSNRLG